MAPMCVHMPIHATENDQNTTMSNQNSKTFNVNGEKLTVREGYSDDSVTFVESGVFSLHVRCVGISRHTNPKNCEPFATVNFWGDMSPRTELLTRINMDLWLARVLETTLIRYGCDVSVETYKRGDST